MSVIKDYYGKDTSKLATKKLFLFDMDGTVYLGDNLFDGVPELLKKIESSGGRFVFITNNSSKSTVDYVKKMHRLGLPDINEEHFFTSAQAAVILMKEKHSEDLIYFQGTQSFERECIEGGLLITKEFSESIGAVLVGFDPEFTGEKVITTCEVLTKLDVPYYATNPDWVCPVEFGYIPDCGSMCQSYERATGKTPTFIGKPKPTMIFKAMQKFGVSSEDTVVIGDRLYTDIASGNNAEVDTICVLSGEVKIDEIDKAQGVEKPTFVLNSVKDLL